jgi:coproporphyrinogen III oxidase-like Fe-S oxidoreductase
MKYLTLVLLAVVALGFLVAPSRAGDEVDKNLTMQMSDILTEWKKITPGTTRTELLTVFTTEGGLSTAKHCKFVHRRCPYIKVDVDFTLSDPKQSIVDERPTDIVSKISKPYLEWSIID